jgi:hypothetical protein
MQGSRDSQVTLKPRFLVLLPFDICQPYFMDLGCRNLQAGGMEQGGCRSTCSGWASNWLQLKQNTSR